MAATIHLFDIDGTLLDGDGAGRRAMELAFAAEFGEDACASLRALRFAGMTDPAIVRAGLRGAGLDPADDARAIAAVLARYLDLLPQTIAQAARFRAHDGVHACLDALAGHGDAGVGLGTGNLERGAALKLAPLGLADRFGFGGYGSDAEDRAVLVAIGAKRGAAALGRPLAACRVVVIGDTPKDVAAAQAIGAQCLAVATSFHGLAELEAAGATLAVRDLTDPAALRFLLG